MAQDVGQGSYVKFGTVMGSNAGSHFRVIDFDWDGIKRDDPVDISHLLSVSREFVASPTYDPGEVSLNVQYDPSLDIISAIASAATNTVVTMYFANGGTALYGYSAFAQVQGISGIKVARDDMMTGTITIKLSGTIGTAAVS